jgi:hypothetical protein
MERYAVSVNFLLSAELDQLLTMSSTTCDVTFCVSFALQVL